MRAEREAFEAYYLEHPEIVQEMEAAARFKVGLAQLRDSGQLEALMKPTPFFRQERFMGIAASLAIVAPPRLKLLLANLQTQSMLLAPIQAGKEKWGFVLMEDCRKPRVWTAEEVTLLKSLAAGLGTALRHKQMRSNLSQTRTQLAEMMLLSGTR